jgi:hypothetical protein
MPASLDLAFTTPDDGTSVGVWWEAEVDHAVRKSLVAVERAIDRVLAGQVCGPAVMVLLHNAWRVADGGEPGKFAGPGERVVIAFPNYVPSRTDGWKPKPVPAWTPNPQRQAYHARLAHRASETAR